MTIDAVRMRAGMLYVHLTSYEKDRSSQFGSLGDFIIYYITRVILFDEDILSPFSPYS